MKVVFTKPRRKMSSTSAAADGSEGLIGEEPIHASRAHVFHIDPESRRKWIPASNQSVPVSIFRDKARNLYRIVSLDEDVVLINSTLTPDMVFSKTSHKFGQWTDSASCQTYGLGFPSEAELDEFVQHFNNLKMKFEYDPVVMRNEDKEAPSGSWGDLLRYENDRLKIALAQSSSNAKKWEMELQLLRNTNERLTTAIQESSANVDKWNRQLSCLKEENARLKLKVIEMEKTSGTCGSLEAQLNDVIERLAQAEKLLSAKDKELVELKMKIESLQQVDVVNKRTRVQYQMAEEENVKLKEDILDLHGKLQHLNLHKDSQAHELRALQGRFNSKMAELMEISEKISELI